MANDEVVTDEYTNKKRTHALATKLVDHCNAELAASGVDDYPVAVTNVIAALQVVVAKTLVLTGVPPAVFMELVTRTMMRSVP